MKEINFKTQVATQTKTQQAVEKIVAIICIVGGLTMFLSLGIFIIKKF